MPKFKKRGLILEEIKEIEIIEPYGFIYITTNIINGRKYIGQKVFKYNWQNYLGSGIALKNAIKKYGRKNFYKEIIAIAYSQQELNDLEIEFIKNHNAVNSENYYNIAYGGDSGNTGLHHSEETKRKISKFFKGKTKSEETKRNMSKAQKGKDHKTREDREKMGVRSFKVFTKNEGKFIGEWLNMNLCSEDLNISTRNIWNCLNWNISSINGYIFIYTNEYTMENINLKLENVKNRKHSKQFNVYKKKDNSFVMSSNHQTDCAEFLNIDCCHITCCLNKNRKSHKGYLFYYVEDDPNIINKNIIYL